MADAEASAFLVPVAEDFEGEIEPSCSIICSCKPVICKLCCDNKRRKRRKVVLRSGTQQFFCVYLYTTL